MDNLIQKKIILSLLDSDPKFANEIADEIGESLAAVADQLTVLVSENICEKVSQGQVKQYIVRKNIEAFAQLVIEFLSDTERHKEEIGQFITSEYYFTIIDYELVNYVLSRFSLNSVYQSDKDKLLLGKILLASPSALLFAMHGDMTIFHQMLSSSDQLDFSEETREWFTQIVQTQFMRPLLEMLIADMRVVTYVLLYFKLNLRVAQVNIEVRLATPNGVYFEAAVGESFTLHKAAEALRPGQLTSVINPMIFSENGLAFLQLGDFQTAVKQFDKAFNAVQNPIEKAIILNNKGLAFFNFKQFQKAIECFEKGIEFDSEGVISQLPENKQLTKEHLARATDADNLTEPTQIRFVQGLPVPFEETLFYEFKEITGGNPANRITKDSDEYAVAFLNREGGRIFWGVRDSDRITIGVTLNEQQRDDVRRIVSEKLGSIDPPISVGGWHLKFHNVYDFQGEAIENLWVIELVVLPPQERDVFYTNSGKLFVKTDGGKQKLQKAEITEFIRSCFQNDRE